MQLYTEIFNARLGITWYVFRPELSTLHSILALRQFVYGPQAKSQCFPIDAMNIMVISALKLDSGVEHDLGICPRTQSKGK